ncbi:spore coat protein [Bacillus siamensis]|uniref:spore coat protein n=1 Tax=Bacillus siamensis TaxID=659243 RepID=UPI002E22512D|nr:spore coat protein [Bacillus siamensis]MED0774615.1 spore coat protein [Bacillus siamensis]MED0779549.1 spore coat protein [Bacillus siamensis]MED0834135.1 spore coat protein [Bacillus siamensis]
MKRNTNRHRSDDNFLHAMEGKVITVYRGGPESKTGRLADIQSDYIALQVDNKIVYYQWKHVKSVTENTSETLSPVEPAECERADDFQDLISRMTNRTVQLNQGGPESKRGKLHETGDDFLVLETEDDGIVYFNADHVKSISAEQEEDGQEEERPEFEMADDFHGIFKRLIHKWVSINRGGPEAVEGILVDNSDGHYTLVKDKEVLRIYPFHIKSISAGAKGAAKKDENQDENKDEKECAEEASHEEQQTSSKKSKRSSKSVRSSKREEDESYSYATVLRTIDYRWKRGRK